MSRARLPEVGDPAVAAVRGKRVAIATAAIDFDPTEVAVPWEQLERHGATVVFATPGGVPGRCDPRMISGEGLGMFAGALKADANGAGAYARLEASGALERAIDYGALVVDDYDAVMLPGGHAPGMKAYLESTALMSFVARFFVTGRPLAAICHGVLLAARSRYAGTDRSILFGRRTTALLRRQEALAWRLTRRGLGDYYRTYPVWLQDEVTAALESPEHFVTGNLALFRDKPDDLGAGFTVRDGNYLSARWPGDAHRFAHDLLLMLSET
jgi:putative intracellular protease/amidase